MIAINSNNKFSVVTVEKWEDYQDKKQQKNNKVTTEEQQSNTNNNVNNIYLFLYKEYAEKIRGKNFNEVIKIIGELRKTEKYNQLSIDEQNNLYRELMSI